MKKPKLSHQVLDYFIQALFIFISVYLAFWLNNRQERREQIRITEQAKVAILEEMNANLRILDGSLEYHQEICQKGYSFNYDTIPSNALFDVTTIPGYRYYFGELLFSTVTPELVNNPDVILPVSFRVQLGYYKDRYQKLLVAYKDLHTFLNQHPYDRETSTRNKYAKFYSLFCKYQSLQELTIKEIKNIKKELE